MNVHSLGADEWNYILVVEENYSYNVSFLINEFYSRALPATGM